MPLTLLYPYHYFEYYKGIEGGGKWVGLTQIIDCGATPGIAWGLLIALCSGITFGVPGTVLELTMGKAGTQPEYCISTPMLGILKFFLL